MFLHQFFVKGLGHASYLVADGDSGDAAVVDPRRDIADYLDLARSEGLRIVEILETHVHNDFVSGAEELRARTGATVRAPAEGRFSRPHRPVADREEIRLGSLRLRVLATPGHTPEHVSYLGADLTRSDDDWVLFAGGALLVGSAARPDLLGGPDEARRAAAVEYATLSERIATLPDWIELYPTHGSGSLCGAGIAGKRWSTIGFERRNNPALRQPDADAFTRFILRDQPAVPAYWRRMRDVNRAGATPLDGLEPARPLLVAEFDHAVGHGAAVVDARPPKAFAAGHVPGALGVGLEERFGTWVGSFVAPDVDIVLVLAAPDDLPEALVQLQRAGYDRVRGYLDGGFDAWVAGGGRVETLRAWRPAEAAAAIDHGEVAVVDVREAAEFRGGHIPGAINIVGAQIPGRLDEIPRGRVVVACASGYRSTVAASYLARNGWSDVGSLRGGTEGYAAAGLSLEVELGEAPGASGAAPPSGAGDSRGATTMTR